MSTKATARRNAKAGNGTTIRLLQKKDWELQSEFHLLLKVRKMFLYFASKAYYCIKLPKTVVNCTCVEPK